MLGCCCGVLWTHAPPVCTPDTFTYTLNGAIPSGETTGTLGFGSVPVSSLLQTIAAYSGAYTTLAVTLCVAGGWEGWSERTTHSAPFAGATALC